MTGDPTTLVALASAGIAGISLASAAALRGWQGWLELKRAELQQRRGRPTPPGRTEVARLKERVRKLEAIALGIDY